MKHKGRGASSQLPRRSDGPCGQRAGGKVGHLSFASSSALKLGSCSCFFMPQFCHWWKDNQPQRHFWISILDGCFTAFLRELCSCKGWLWGFLPCKGHVAAVCAFPAHKPSGLDAVVKPHALQNTPPHIDIKRSTMCLQTEPCALSHRYHSHMLTNTGCRALTKGSFAKLWLSREDPENFPFPQGSPTGLATKQSLCCGKRARQGSSNVPAEDTAGN